MDPTLIATDIFMLRTKNSCPYCRQKNFDYHIPHTFHMSIKCVGLNLYYPSSDKHIVSEDYVLSAAFIYSVKQSKCFWRSSHYISSKLLEILTQRSSVTSNTI
jgi:hypothetical protein